MDDPRVTVTSDICINCGQSLTRAAPKDCPDHTSRIASDTRRILAKRPQQAAKTVTKAYRGEDWAHALLKEIGEAFDVDPESLTQIRQPEFRMKFARYFALYLAQRLDATGEGCAAVGNLLHITTPEGRKIAIKTLNIWIHKDTEHAEVARRLLQKRNLTLPA